MPEEVLAPVGGDWVDFLSSALSPCTLCTRQVWITQKISHLSLTLAVYPKNSLFRTSLFRRGKRRWRRKCSSLRLPLCTQPETTGKGWFLSPLVSLIGCPSLVTSLVPSGVRGLHRTVQASPPQLQPRRTKKPLHARWSTFLLPSSSCSFVLHAALSTAHRGKTELNRLSRGHDPNSDLDSWLPFPLLLAGGGRIIVAAVLCQVKFQPGRSLSVFRRNCPRVAVRLSIHPTRSTGVQRANLPPEKKKEWTAHLQWGAACPASSLPTLRDIPPRTYNT